MAISVDLGPRWERLVASLVSSGRYRSKSAVLREGVRLLQKREKWVAALNRALDRGLADVKAGRVKPADEVFARLDAKYRKMAKSRRRTTTRSS
jgi:antitoxin ParD1/3/4